MTELAQAFLNKTAVCGVGLKIGKYPDRTHLSLAAESFKLALDDCGMKREDVDGLICLSFGSDYDRLLEALGVNVRYAYQGWSHGRFISPMLQQAAMVVGMGLAKTVASSIGAEVDAINPIETLSSADLNAGKNYISVQTQNIENVAKGLRCSE